MARSRPDLLFRAFAASLLLAAVAAGVPAAAGAQTAPQGQATASPATDLVNQVVTVSWSNFQPTTFKPFLEHTVAAIQCDAHPVHFSTDCFPGDHDVGQIAQSRGYTFGWPGVDPRRGYGITQPDGTGSAGFEVRPAVLDPGLNCKTSNPCSLVVFDHSDFAVADTIPSSAVIIPLGFAPTTADCPELHIDVKAEGEASAARPIYGWGAQLCGTTPPLGLDYTEQSSPLGRETFLASDVDLGVSVTPPSAAEVAAGRAPRAYGMGAIDANAVVVAFSARDAVTGQPITHMNLSPRLVAMIVADGADSASVSANALNNDAEFQELNPGVNWPVAWYWPFLRSENNDDTLLVTNWLKTDHDANTFLAGNDPCGRQPEQFWKGVQDHYPTDRFSSLDPSLTGFGYFPRAGTYANASRLAHRIINVAPDPLSGGTKDGPADPALGMFGILDLGTAIAFGLPVANLSPAVATSNLTGTGPGCTLAAGGAAPVAADGTGLTAAYSLLAPDPLVTGADPYAAQTTPGAYPLAKVDYAIAPTSGVTDAGHAAEIAQVLSWAATDGQEATNRPIGYPALPDPFRAQTAGLADAVKNQTGATNPPPVPVPPLQDPGPAPLGVAATSLASAPLSGAGTLTTSFRPSTPTTSGSGAAGVNPAPSSSSDPAASVTVVTPASVAAVRAGYERFWLPALAVAGVGALIAGPILSRRPKPKQP